MTSQAIQSFSGVLPTVGKQVYIHDSASVIGQVSLGQHCSVWPGAVIRGDVNRISIGAGTNIQDLSVLHVSNPTASDPEGAPLVIGENVTVGHSVILHGCTIENECLIGMGSIVMDKVLVQKHVLVAAGSLVPEGKVLESGYLYVGSPVRRMRPLSEEEIAHFKHSADHYIALKNQYLAGS